MSPLFSRLQQAGKTAHSGANSTVANTVASAHAGPRRDCKTDARPRSLPTGQVEAANGLRIQLTEPRQANAIRFEWPPLLLQVRPLDIVHHRVLIGRIRKNRLCLPGRKKLQKLLRGLRAIRPLHHTGTTHIHVRTTPILIRKKDPQRRGNLAIFGVLRVGQQAQIIGVDQRHICKARSNRTHLIPITAWGARAMLLRTAEAQSIAAALPR